MSRLKIILRGTQISEIGLSPEREYIGGRKDSCDIRLQPEKGISREHFNLKFEDNKWKISSLSRFGEIYSLGQRIESAFLDHGQSFQIPPYEFNYVEINDEVGFDNSKSDVQDISENERTVIGAVQQVPYIKMLSSKGEVREMLRLEFGEIWVAGRDSSCQIIIPDQRVSRRQFEIRKINGIYTIIDMDSVNGTFVNGSVVSSTDPVPLKSGDAITVLDNTMYFELHDPNFQYRIDRIDIPAFQINQDIEDVNFENNEYENNENIAAENYNQLDTDSINDQLNPSFNNLDPNQLNISGGPFTGLPSDQLNSENQYYSFQPSETAAPTKNLFEKFKSNKPLLILTVILFLGSMYMLSEYLNQPAELTIAKKSVNAADPFSQLTEAQQKEVQELYDKVQSEMIQGKYDMAKEDLAKIHKIIPTGYQDSKEKYSQVIENEQTIIEQKAQEEAEKARLESEEKIKKNISECEKLVNRDLTEDKMANCLAEALALNPEHPDVMRLIKTARKMTEDRKSKDQEETFVNAQIKELDQIFDAAENLRKAGYPYKAIKAYSKVIESTLPDPKKMKTKAKNKIIFIEETIKTHTDANLKNAEQFIKDGKLKLAVKALNDALQYDPDNRSLKDKSEKYTNELRLQAMAIYQESIIDENFGYVEGNETRPGAKDKWKKIIDLDLEDGEYYRKAYVKLKKYGVF